jgi:PKD repeat protein
MKKFIFFLILSLFIFSCKKEPSADFSFTGILEVGQAIMFSNLSKNTDTQSWDFGDGAVSTASSPSHIYPKPGQYTVSLTAQGNGKSVSKNKTLNITGTTYSFTNNTTIPLYEFISFYYDGSYHDLTQHGLLESGKTTSIVITSRNKIFFAFTFIVGGYFYFSAYPYYLTSGRHNDLFISDTTSISGGSKSKSLPDYGQIEKLLMSKRPIN